MGDALKVGDLLTGHAGEHGGHYYPSGAPVHPSNTITGKVSGGSPNVNIGGFPAARKGDSTTETDPCTNGTGTVASGSSSVFINGKPAARQQDALKTHAGSGNFIITGSSVQIGD